MLSPDAQMIDRRILQEAHTLIKAGHKVQLLSGFECREPDAYEDDGLTIKRYSYDWQDRRRMSLRKQVGPILGALSWPAVRLATRLADGPNSFEAFVLEKVMEHQFDLVHVHDFPMLRVASLAAKARGVPLIYDSHEFYPVQACFSPEQRKRFLALECRLVRECAEIITVNPYIARMIGQEHGITPPNVILNACEPPASTARDLTPDRRRDLRLAKGLPPDSFIFVYQGWISSERNLEPMIEAMAKQTENVSLLLVGYGDYLEKLRELADRVGATERVIFYGRVESDDLPELTQLCDVGIVPYRAVDEMHRYCSPNKLFEFVSAQLPILANDLPFLRDIVAGYEIGWLGELEQADSFAEYLKNIVADEVGLARARGNLPKAAAELSWSVEGDKLLDIYAGIWGGKQARLSPAGDSPQPGRNASKTL